MKLIQKLLLLTFFALILNCPSLIGQSNPIEKNNKRQIEYNSDEYKLILENANSTQTQPPVEILIEKEGSDVLIKMDLLKKEKKQNKYAVKAVKPVLKKTKKDEPILRKTNEVITPSNRQKTL